jgi:type I restriction enzyme S subunit
MTMTVAVNQKIPVGYKQTEIGVIPDDWDVKELREIIDFSNGKAHENFISDDGDYIVVNSKFISTEGQVVKYSKQCFCPAPANSILMVMSDVPNGRAIAKCFLVDRNNKYTVNQRICALKSKIDSKFLFYKIDRNPFYLSFDDGVKQTNLKKDDILDCKLSIPQDKIEQTAVAAALSDMDALIEKLEEVIEKKKNIKQGALQELLTGKSRLPGFEKKQGYKETDIGLIPKDWDLVTYDQAFSFLRTAAYSRDQLIESGACLYVHYGDIHTKWNHFLDFSKKELPSIEKDKICNYSFIKDGDLVMADASEDYEGIGKSVEINNLGNKKAISGLHTFLLRDKDNFFANGFKGYIHSNILVKQSMDRLATGLKVYGVSKNNLKLISIPRPSIPEQQAIASIITEMALEIEKLESQLTKYKNLKQGMMQKLLTGQIRLIKK